MPELPRAPRHLAIGTGEQRALAMGLPFLGGIPLLERARGATRTRPVVLTEPTASTAAFASIAGQLARRVSIHTLAESAHA